MDEFENIKDIVNEFKRLTEPQRLAQLEVIMADEETKSGLNWRAHLITALRSEDVYPYLKEKPPQDDDDVEKEGLDR